MFKSLPVYIRISRNHVEITNLETGETCLKKSVQEFSNERMVLSDFNHAEQTIRSALKELNINRSFFKRSLTVLIQQTEGAEDGLTDIEKRALRDLAEIAGGKTVYIVTNHRILSTDEAVTFLKEQ